MTETDQELTRNMARLSAGLRKIVPATDQWQVSVVNLTGNEDDPWLMVEMRFSRIVDGQKWNYSELISPAMLAQSRATPEWIGEFIGKKWLAKVAEAIAGSPVSKIVAN